LLLSGGIELTAAVLGNSDPSQETPAVESPAAGQEVVSIEWQGETVRAVADEWIIRLGDDIVAGDKYEWLYGSLADSGITAASVEAIGGSAFGVLEAPELAADQVAAWVATQSKVLYAEPNFVYSLVGAENVESTTPNDPGFTGSSLWGLHNTGQSGGTVDADIDAPEAWDLATGSRDVVVAVIDTGVDHYHPDLAANMWTNPGEVNGDGVDNDGNGYVDDIHGWDFYNNDNNPMDGHNHGTHVAGTIGATGDNSQGVVGVNWEVSIMALKFLNDEGEGTTADAISAIDYAAKMRRDYGVNVVATNNSWGGGGYSTALRDAIEAAGREGILFIAAAGNDSVNTDVVAHYPSNYDSEYIISVAATTRNDGLASFSNYGSATVDLAAPGRSIYSSMAGGGYGRFSGTSMATPHVTGVVALLASLGPGASAGEIKAAILSGTDPVLSLSGKSVTGGRLNAHGALVAMGTLGPRVMWVDPSGDSGPVDTISIAFSEDIDPASVVGANFRLRDNGEDNVFDTADDNEIALGEANVSQPQGDRVVISLGADLPFEQYRLTVPGAGANPLRDTEGNPLGDGSDHEHSFVITSPYGPFEPNDRLADATATGLSGPGTITFSGAIGDGYEGGYDVDLFSFEAGGPMTVTLDTDAVAIGSSLDTILRLFDSGGNELTVNDDSGGQDSFIQYELTAAGTYYAGVSGYSNFNYDPAAPGSGDSEDTGDYDLTVNLAAWPEIHGSKWDDLDGDGARDGGEPGLEGWVIFLDDDADGVLDPGETATTTDANGDFAFVGLTAGAYVVSEVRQAGWERTYPVEPPGGPYVPHSISASFEDISSSGRAILRGADDKYGYLSPSDLGGFEFPLYGTTYDRAYVNSNGLVTFGGTATGWMNTDLSFYPTAAAVAAFWDDLYITGESDTGVYWEVRGSGDDGRLIVQWQNVEFYHGSGDGTVTFQAVLGANGNITLNHQDLASGYDGSEGEEATVGIKDAGFFVDRLLLSCNSGPGRYVGTGRSTRISRPLIGQHPVSLDPGEVATDILFGSVRALSVVSEAAENVTGTAASLRGEVVSTGGEDPEVHVVWGVQNGGTSPGSWDNDVGLGVMGAGGIAHYAAGLTPATQYYFNVYAINSSGVQWSQLGSFVTFIAGDADGDGAVGGSDTGVFMSQFGMVGPGLSGDFDGDGGVDFADFAILRANFGHSTAAEAELEVQTAGETPIAAKKSGQPVPAVSVSPVGTNVSRRTIGRDLANRPAPAGGGGPAFVGITDVLAEAARRIAETPLPTAPDGHAGLTARQVGIFAFRDDLPLTTASEVGRTTGLGVELDGGLVDILSESLI